MVQNIEVLRFANAMFEPLWNNKYISNIQVTSSEILGVEDRGGYYESSGALKDMVQNHMLQMVALLAMEAPISLNSEDIRAEKVKYLNHCVISNLKMLKRTLFVVNMAKAISMVNKLKHTVMKIALQMTLTHLPLFQVN